MEDQAMKTIKSEKSRDGGDSHTATALLKWYDNAKRDLPWRRTSDPYAIWLSEIMLQQTQVKTVIPYYRSFLTEFPTVVRLADAQLDQVYNVWQGLGYYSRARRLWEGAKYLVETNRGELPQTYAELIEIPGVGDYTAGAIASIAFGEKVGAVDGNVKRVMARLLGWTGPIEKADALKAFKSRIKEWQPEDRAGDFNQGLIELGATVCTPKKARCAECPLRRDCLALEKKLVADLPVVQRRQKQMTVVRLLFVIRKGKQIYLQKRAEQGLLAGLWEIPGVDIQSLQEIEKGDLFAFYRKAVQSRTNDQEISLLLQRTLPIYGPVWHIFSHRRWQMFWLVLDLEAEKVGKREEIRERSSLYGDQRYVSLEGLNEVALPVAFSEIIRSI